MKLTKEMIAEMQAAKCSPATSVAREAWDEFRRRTSSVVGPGGVFRVWDVASNGVTLMDASGGKKFVPMCDVESYTLVPPSEHEPDEFVTADGGPAPEGFKTTFVDPPVEPDDEHESETTTEVASDA